MYWLSTTAPSCSNSTLIMPPMSSGRANSATLVRVTMSSSPLPLMVKTIWVPPSTTSFGSIFCSVTRPVSTRLYGSNSGWPTVRPMS